MRSRVKVQEVAFGSTDPFSLEALEHYEEAYRTAQAEGKVIRAVLLCNPHNPLGLFMMTAPMSIALICGQGVAIPQQFLRNIWHFATAGAYT